ncbi:MAG: putative TIM-barrel fold metal-dependent hydrolase, partial [Deltaproteobacteria bacterium]|nr:putative TIM-barrel fold metal-dependent hydrolase [Deltaproteobacteria bacterium]
CVVAGGLLERFSRLKFAFMEAGCGWVPYWMERLDEHFEFLQPTVPWLTKPPSEYMKSGQMFYAFEMDEKMLPYVAEFVGAERLVFATDYNHSVSPHRRGSDGPQRFVRRVESENHGRERREAV